jgi:hypothetical protein
VYYLAEVTGGIDAGLVQELEGAGAAVRFGYPEIGWVALSSTLEAVASVSQLARVERLDLDRPMEVLGTTVQLPRAQVVQLFGDQSKRGTGDVGADDLWAQGITGAGVRVGVVDSGIDGLHPDVDDQLQGFVNCMGVLPGVFVGDPPVGACVEHPAVDDNGHGTHVAGTIVGDAQGLLPTHLGQVPGMAPDAELVGAKVCNAAGSCLNSGVLAGIRHLALEPAQGGFGADVINISLGSGRFYFSPVFGAEQVTNAGPSEQLLNALAELNNVLFSVSAGNSGPVLQSVGSPSVAAQAMSVGASIADYDLNHPAADTFHGAFGDVRPEAAAAGASGIAQFSSRGPSGDRLLKPDVTAPGSYVVAPQASTGAELGAVDTIMQNKWSLDPLYSVLSGTSMAAPSAAGVAALVWSGFEQTVGAEPRYHRIKAALANTAGTRAFEGPITGLTSGLRARYLGEDPQALFPLRNEAYVGNTGEGAGRVNAPAALLAVTRGVTIYTPASGTADAITELQPSWSADDVAPGASVSQTFVLDGSPRLAGTAKTNFAVETESEPLGVGQAAASWFRLPKNVTTAANQARPFTLTLQVPAGTAPGMYEATIVASSKISTTVTQRSRLPVQVFVPTTIGASLEGPIWAESATDYSVVGFEDPLGDIFTDWTLIPMTIPAGSGPIELSVYDVGGLDHMDVFVFTEDGLEVDSTVASDLLDSVPGGAAYMPTTEESPHVVSINDTADFVTLALPATVWIAVSDSGPDVAGFSTYHLDVRAA